MEKNCLFQIDTDDVELTWSSPAGKSRALIDGLGDYPGRLHVKTLRDGTRTTISLNPSGQGEPEVELSAISGPQLHEQVDYSICLRSKVDRRKTVRLFHIDPNVCKNLLSVNEGELTYGTINFRSDVGLSKFVVYVDGTAEFEFEVEVFPTKMDYKSDYQELVAETQDYVAGLAYEYLRATYQLSSQGSGKQSGTIEWLLLLKMVVADLARAVEFVNSNPTRGLVRQKQIIKTEKIKRLDSYVRASIQKGEGAGGFITGLNNLQVRQKVHSQNTNFTTDTPEHRWISSQLKRIKSRLFLLRSYEESSQQNNRWDRSEKKEKILDELRTLEIQIARLQTLEIFHEVKENPPPGFASLQLLAAPGYRECYKTCNILSRGLNIEGGPINLSMKEISLLYEYWCFLTIVDLLSQSTGQSIPVSKLVKSTNNGLVVQLVKGHESNVRFHYPDGRRIDLTYNKKSHGEMLIPQQPDITITLHEPDWPALTLLLDVKYRIRFEKEYKAKYNQPGPDEDAVNVLHRYRDAILDQAGIGATDKPKRTVVQAAAVFPYRESHPDDFRTSKLWQSLDRLGIGAIPLLPQGKQYLQEWLASVLTHGGWSLAGRVLGHTAADKGADWRVAASEPVLVGVLRPEIASVHLQWIIEHKCYFMPLLKDHPRQLSVKYVAIYVPALLDSVGAVKYRAKISRIDIQPRSSIATPWTSARDDEKLNVVYYLETVEEMSRPIINRTDESKGQRFSSPRWASRLSLERAQVLNELFLESEPEWKLYEELRASNVPHTLVPGRPNALVEDTDNWRTWFRISGDFFVRYAGMQGYKWKQADRTGYCPNIGAVLSLISKTIAQGAT